MLDDAHPDAARLIDRIDVNDRPRPLLDPATESLRRAQAEDLTPGDVLPMPRRDGDQPAGADDLDSSAPRVEASEEWGEKAPTLAGNIRLDKLDSPQSIAQAIAHTNARVGGFDAATRGRITHAETERLAGELGMTADDLLKRRKGQALNAEEALASRQILARSATDLVNMAKRIKAMDTPGEEVEAGFKEAWLRHVAIQEQVSGMTAEAGRALSAFRMAADARAVDRVLPSLGDIMGGRLAAQGRRR
ncbi:hypothetical protein QP162_21910 [Sphingomonas aurantiaca]|uniref:hypothetical protein n=1 Tax=Sphingomonas aurantiaca TaxID=185949 RepID=UPI002FE3EA32